MFSFIIIIKERFKTCEDHRQKKRKREPLDAKEDTPTVFFLFWKPKPIQTITEKERIEQDLNTFLFVFYCEIGWWMPICV